MGSAKWTAISNSNRSTNDIHVTHTYGGKEREKEERERGRNRTSQMFKSFHMYFVDLVHKFSDERANLFWFQRAKFKTNPTLYESNECGTTDGRTDDVMASRPKTTAITHFVLAPRTRERGEVRELESK